MTHPVWPWLYRKLVASGISPTDAADIAAGNYVSGNAAVATEQTRATAAEATNAAGLVALRNLTDATFLANLNTAYFRQDVLRATGAYGETVPRNTAMGSSANITSGTLRMYGLFLPKNSVVGNLSFQGSAAAVTPTNWWFALFNSSRTMLARTADQTTAAWSGNALKTLPIAQVATGAGTSFTTTYDGLYYIGVMMAATTPVTLMCATYTNSNVLGRVPILAGNADTGLTTPPSFPFTATTLNSVTNVGYASVDA